MKFFKHYFLCGPLFKVFNEFVTTFCLIHVSGFWPWGMWDLSSQTSDQTVLPALEAKVSARDSQGGPSPRPCPGLPGLSRFTPPPQHRPSSLSPCSACPSVPTRMQPLPAAASPAPNSCSGAPLSCACPLPLSRPRSVLQFPEHPQGLGAQQLTPISPNSTDTGTVWGRVYTTRRPRRHHTWCAVRVPEACPVRPAHNTQEGPQQHAGGPCSGLLISECQQGHRGLGDCLTRRGRQSPAACRSLSPRPAAGSAAAERPVPPLRWSSQGRQGVLPPPEPPQGS